MIEACNVRKTIYEGFCRSFVAKDPAQTKIACANCSKTKTFTPKRISNGAKEMQQNGES